jgi:hypothetical protein
VQVSWRTSDEADTSVPWGRTAVMGSASNLAVSECQERGVRMKGHCNGKAEVERMFAEFHRNKMMMIAYAAPISPESLKPQTRRPHISARCAPQTSCGTRRQFMYMSALGRSCDRLLSSVGCLLPSAACGL